MEVIIEYFVIDGFIFIVNSHSYTSFTCVSIHNDKYTSLMIPSEMHIYNSFWIKLFIGYNFYELSGTMFYLQWKFWRQNFV